MKRFLAAALMALLLAGYASADYQLIVVNLNAKDPSKQESGGGDKFGGGPAVPPMSGGPMVPPMGGGKGGPGPKGGEPEDADDSPDLIVAVVEVKSISKNFAKEFGDGKREIKFQHHWGKIDLVSKTWLYEATLLKKSEGGALPTVKERFAAREKEVIGDGKDNKPPTREVVRKVAQFALELGLVDECAKVMDKLAESDKDNPSVKAYRTVKAEMDKPLRSSTPARTSPPNGGRSCSTAIRSAPRTNTTSPSSISTPSAPTRSSRTSSTSSGPSAPITTGGR